MNSKEFSALCKILKQYDESYATFYGKVVTNGSESEVKSIGVINVEYNDTKPSLLINKETTKSVLIRFNDTFNVTQLTVFDQGEIIVDCELVDICMEFMYQEKIIHKGWNPSDDIRFTSNAINTTTLSVSEHFFYRELLDVLRENIGSRAKMWVLAFDETAIKVEARMHGEIDDTLLTKGYYIEGVVLQLDDNSLAIKTIKEVISLSFHEVLGVPSTIGNSTFQILLISDLYAVVDETVIQPKNLTPSSLESWKAV